jgi:uncharacterized repeat protein (TIGR03803 family)
MQTKATNPLFLAVVVLLLRLVAPCACGQVTFTTLLSFQGTNGSSPVSLVQGTDGILYGTTSGGGTASAARGTAFRITSEGLFTSLVSFNGTNGAYPRGLVEGADGNFYGTTFQGGAYLGYDVNGAGTVFRMTPQGVLTTLVSFYGTNGASPRSGLVQGTDGSFYGTTTMGGSNTSFPYGGGMGTVFQVTTNGTITTLLHFNGTNGVYPSFAGVVQGADGDFYGTTPGTYVGNSNGFGTIFRMTPTGTLTTLFTFGATNGGYCYDGLVQGEDGAFYGATDGAVTGVSVDTIFRMTTDGTFRTLFSFDGTNGAFPLKLVQGKDGSFYGVTRLGGTGYTNGSYGNGTIFRITPDGSFTMLFHFNGTNGANPFGGLLQGRDGDFYGTTTSGGSGYNGTAFSGYGTVFRVSLQPVISVQPQSQANNAGATVTFLVSATSLDPLVYQWQKHDTNLVDGGNISGATTSALTIASISDGDAASYSVIVSNPFGSATSSNAVLTVDDSLFIVSQPQSQTVGLGSNVTFNATVYGASPMVFQWYFNGAPLGPPTPGTHFSSCTLTNVGTNQAGNYSVLAVNGYGSLMSSNAVLTVKAFPPSIEFQPLSQSVILGSSAWFTVSVSGTPPFHYQWQFNGANLLNSTNAAYVIQVVGATNAGNYCVVVTNSAGSVTSSNAVLALIDPPLITAQPANLLVLPGTNVAFGVSVTGTAPFGYQWEFNGTNILNATNALYSMPSVGTNDAGNYAVAITNAAGRVTSSNAALAVVLSPQSQTNTAGATATFTATAFSSAPLNYQWQKDGTNLVEGANLSGTTNSTLTIASISDVDAASYRAVVSDAYASVTTSNAVLTVIHLPLITAQPTNLLVLPGTNVAFRVSVTGTAPFGYQWQSNGTNLLYATNALYSIPSVGTNDAGNYAVVITSAAGSVTSSNAALTVVFSPQSQTNIAGATATFTATAFSPESLNYQWQKDGTNLVDGGSFSGTTNSTLTIASISDVDAASYSAVVSDAYGSVTTSNVVLMVIHPPTLALQLWAGYPLLNLSGMVSNNFVVQYSTNLVGTNWRNLLSLTNLPYSPYLFLDPAGDGEPARFYRAFMQ